MKLTKLRTHKDDHYIDHSSGSLGTSANTQSTPLPMEPQTNTRTNGFHVNPSGTYTEDEFMDLAQTMQRRLKIKDRTYRFKKYTHVFVGQQAIDFLVSHLQLSTRQAAMELAHQMNNVLHCYEQVVSKRTLDSKSMNHYYYSTTSSTAASSDLPTADRLEDSEFAFYRFTHYVVVAKRVATTSTADMMRAFQRGVKVENRTFLMKTYHNVFLGSDAVDYLVAQKFAASRVQAVQLGRRLAKEYDLFVHVTGEHELKDDIFLYYRMLPPKTMQVDKDKAKALKQKEKQILHAYFVVSILFASFIYYYFY